MVVDRLNQEDCKNGAILDGFPRTVEQAEKLDEILAEKGKKVDLVVNLTTPRDEIITRILNRRVCSNQDCKATYNLTMHPSKVPGICDKCGSKLVQREDDSNEAAIRQRLEIYDEKTSPLIDLYTKNNILLTLPSTADTSYNRFISSFLLIYHTSGKAFLISDSAE